MRLWKSKGEKVEEYAKDRRNKEMIMDEGNQSKNKNKRPREELRDTGIPRAVERTKR